MALLATTRPTLPAPALHLAALAPAPALAVLLEAPTTAPVLALLASAASVLDTLSARTVSLATTLPTQPPLALTVALDLVQDLAALAPVVLDLA